MDASKSASPQQLEAARFGSAVSENLLSTMQENINYLLSAVCPVGTVLPSMLSESQFQAIVGTGWVLADGGSCSGSSYATVTGNTTVPDLRGVFLRGRNHARSGTTGDTGGDRATGNYQSDQMISHTHPYLYRTPSASSGGSDGGGDHTRGLNDVNSTTSAAGAGTETRPRNVSVEYFIRID